MGIFRKNNKKSGFTLMEIALAVLIVAILAMLTVPMVQRQLSKSDEYAYYTAYKTIEKLGEEEFFHKAYQETLQPVYGDAAQADDLVVEGGVIK